MALRELTPLFQRRELTPLWHAGCITQAMTINLTKAEADLLWALLVLASCETRLSAVQDRAICTFERELGRHDCEGDDELERRLDRAMTSVA